MSHGKKYLVVRTDHVHTYLFKDDLTEDQAKKLVALLSLHNQKQYYDSYTYVDETDKLALMRKYKIVTL